MSSSSKTSVDGALPPLRSIGSDRIPPDLAGLIDALSRIGYSLEAAVTDVIDNAIDAEAKNVLVRFFRRGDILTRVAIVDDGTGISRGLIRKALTFGGKAPHAETDLGKYGVGLKLASFSQAKSVSVITRSGSAIEARRWTVAGIAKDWQADILDRRTAVSYLDADWYGLTSPAGTVVMWDDLPSFRGGRADVLLGQMHKSLSDHVGLYLHRFLSGKSVPKVRIHIDVRDDDAGMTSPPWPITALDPFGYPISGHKDYPKTFRADIPGVGVLSMKAHIWPPTSQSPNYKLGGKRVAIRQGLYFYRNGRLLQPGSWNGWQSEGETHLSLARVEIHLTPELEESFRPNAQKAGVDVPPGFVDALDSASSGDLSFHDYVARARDVYSRKKRESGGAVALPKSLARSAGMRRVLRADGAKTVPVPFRWSLMPADEFFRVGDDGVQINTRFKDEIGDFRRLQILLLMAIRDELERGRSSTKGTTFLVNLSRLLAGDDE